MIEVALDSIGLNVANSISKYLEAGDYSNKEEFIEEISALVNFRLKNASADNAYGKAMYYVLIDDEDNAVRFFQNALAYQVEPEYKAVIVGNFTGFLRKKMLFDELYKVANLYKSIISTSLLKHSIFINLFRFNISGLNEVVERYKKLKIMGDSEYLYFKGIENSMKIFQETMNKECIANITALLADVAHSHSIDVFDLQYIVDSDGDKSVVAFFTDDISPDAYASLNFDLWENASDIDGGDIFVRFEREVNRASVQCL